MVLIIVNIKIILKQMAIFKTILHFKYSHSQKVRKNYFFFLVGAATTGQSAIIF